MRLVLFRHIEAVGSTQTLTSSFTCQSPMGLVDAGILSLQKIPQLGDLCLTCAMSFGAKLFTWIRSDVDCGGRT